MGRVRLEVAYRTGRTASRASSFASFGIACDLVRCQFRHLPRAFGRRRKRPYRIYDAARVCRNRGLFTRSMAFCRDRPPLVGKLKKPHLVGVASGPGGEAGTAFCQDVIDRGHQRIFRGTGKVTSIWLSRSHVGVRGSRVCTTALSKAPERDRSQTCLLLGDPPQHPGNVEAASSDDRAGLAAKPGFEAYPRADVRSDRFQPASLRRQFLA